MTGGCLSPEVYRHTEQCKIFSSERKEREKERRNKKSEGRKEERKRKSRGMKGRNL